MRKKFSDVAHHYLPRQSPVELQEPDTTEDQLEALLRSVRGRLGASRGHRHRESGRDEEGDAVHRRRGGEARITAQEQCGAHDGTG
nr:hypothetical protein [Clavibacter capsici]